VAAPVAQAPAPVVVRAAKVIYVQENQPVHLVDSQGRLLQVVYLRKAQAPVQVQ
jgi:hypothetical protein